MRAYGLAPITLASSCGSGHQQLQRRQQRQPAERQQQVAVEADAVGLGGVADDPVGVAQRSFSAISGIVPP